MKLLRFTHKTFPASLGIFHIKSCSSRKLHLIAVAIDIHWFVERYIELNHLGFQQAMFLPSAWHSAFYAPTNSWLMSLRWLLPVFWHSSVCYYSIISKFPQCFLQFLNTICRLAEELPSASSTSASLCVAVLYRYIYTYSKDLVLFKTAGFTTSN